MEASAKAWGWKDLVWAEEVQCGSQERCLPSAHPKPNGGGFITQAAVLAPRAHLSKNSSLKKSPSFHVRQQKTE